MSILIKELDMPEGNEMLCINISPDGRVCIDMDLKCKPVAQAVKIPPHGDLIERKAAYDSILNGMVMTGYQSRALDCINEFWVPTIIEAEEG